MCWYQISCKLATCERIYCLITPEGKTSAAEAHDSVYKPQEKCQEICSQQARVNFSRAAEEHDSVYNSSIFVYFSNYWSGAFSLSFKETLAMDQSKCCLGRQ